MEYTAVLFAMAVGSGVFSIIIFWALMNRDKSNYRLEAAQVTQDLRDRRMKRDNIGARVLAQKHFEEYVLVEALNIVNSNMGVVEAAERILLKGLKEDMK